MAIDTDIPTEKQDASPAASPVLGVHDRVDEISLLDLLIALTKRKRLTFAITLVCGNLGLVVALILPKCYTAVATILSQQQSSSMASAFASQIGKPGDDGFACRPRPRPEESQRYVCGDVQQSNGRRRDDPALQAHARMPPTIPVRDAESIREQLYRQRSGKDGLIHVSVEDKDPKRAAEMANAWIKEFRNLSQTLAISEASQRRLFFELQMQQAKDNLAKAEEVERGKGRRHISEQIFSEDRQLAG